MFALPAGDTASFQRAASRIDRAFNWFGADSRTAAYCNSGINPVRAADVDPATSYHRPEQALFGGQAFRAAHRVRI
ncbi:hypothetical protein OHA98_27400 [Streptomyces sp. NBC_00654]|uniref:hypothetical protein n=1 Tax=Streptomyces sp. NBC_00654 TaxID=2975799 RepID=UPI0022518F8C|nr:hypothetical protein [Streptomyces sp. NBC_00654]MCX4968416.1 hypothetical protein [Streptomyces sp. NBC_00654]